MLPLQAKTSPKQSRFSKRAQRRAAERLLSRVRTAENRYAKDLRVIIRSVHAEYMRYFEPRLKEVATRQDARVTKHSSELDLLGVQVEGAVDRHVAVAFDRMANIVKDASKLATETLIGIKPSDLGLGGIIAQRRTENLQLIRNATKVYQKQVRDIFEDPMNWGLRVEELKVKLLERGRVSESRAELIARDQTLKLNGQINQTRQRAAGVEKYRWSTSHDDRVRPEHAELDGEVFDWNVPPEPGHPGEDFQCRCVAIPVIEEAEGL